MSPRTGLCVATMVLICICCPGCSDPAAEESLPAVNDENCTDANVARIRDQKAREKFSTLCAFRSTYKPSQPRTW
ncbi:MAG: entry exclusion lipoprotein TrbK [Burkholderiaceae bacterium]|nr:entry exclusion lipoprotein TrbK [Burkholderiaceae bacterium]